MAYHLILNIPRYNSSRMKDIEMIIDPTFLIWSFPIFFMLHDFEELVFGEAWLKRNAGMLLARLAGKIPTAFETQIGRVLQKTTPELALPICLIFCLTGLASFFAVEIHSYPFFLLAASTFFLHGFMHIGQALLLRKYVPAVISSVCVVVPYGFLLFRALLQAGLITWTVLLVYFALAIALTIPFILVMHKVGEAVYKLALRLLVS
jgi:hypothetical protein